MDSKKVSPAPRIKLIFRLLLYVAAPVMMVVVVSIFNVAESQN